MRPQAARAVKGNKTRGWITPITSQLSERAESCLRNIGALSRSLFGATLTLPRALCNVFSGSALLPLNFVFFSYTCVNTRQRLRCEGSLSHLAQARMFSGRKVSIVALTTLSTHRHLYGRVVTRYSHAPCDRFYRSPMPWRALQMAFTMQAWSFYCHRLELHLDSYVADSSRIFNFLWLCLQRWKSYLRSDLESPVF